MKNIKIVTILQWIVIILLVLGCLYFYNKNNSITSEFTAKIDEKTTLIAHQSKDISDLKKTNKELYDKYHNEPNVEYIVQYKYKVEYDTVFIEPTIVIPTDDLTVNEYVYSSDTAKFFNYNINVLSEKQPKEVKFDYVLNDKFTIVNKNDGDNNQTLITTESGSEIIPTTVFRKKEKFFDRFTIGPQLGVGYGTFNQKFDVYLGVGITYKLK